MTHSRDGHVRVLPLHVANKIAAGEVVERPSSVVKELVENSIDAGASRIAVSIVQGGRKLVSVLDDGCGMTRDDAVLSLERQATSKIRDVTDIEQIDTLGFRGEAIPSIASVSRFSITTRRAGSDEGTFLQVNAGTLSEVRSAGCPAGTLVEVRDLFCNVPARRKFLRAYATEEAHVKSVFTLCALAHKSIGFSLSVDGRETCRLPPAKRLEDRVRDLFGDAFVDSLLLLPEGSGSGKVTVSGYVERPGLSSPTRRDQYVFVNGRPATTPSIAVALREALPRRAGDGRPAAILFLEMPPSMVDVNVHPTKREVRFRDNVAVRDAIAIAVGAALSSSKPAVPPPAPAPQAALPTSIPPAASPVAPPVAPSLASTPTIAFRPPLPVQVEFAADPETPRTKPWQWFRYLAQSQSGYLLVETDSGIVTINPRAARERIVYERMLPRDGEPVASQTLLIPETVRLGPADAARITAALDTLRAEGFQIEPFGADVFKIDAVPQAAESLPVAEIVETVAHDLAEAGTKRGGAKWREEAVAKAVAKSHAGASSAMTAEGAVALVEALCSCRMPYVCPRGKPVMIFTSTRELDRKFGKTS